jgi:hypothetical protein
MDHITVRSL